MLINFDKIEATTIKNFRGGEKNTVAQMFVDEKHRIMYSTLEPGASIGLHEHEPGSEVVYILQGKGKALYDEGQEELLPGACHYCPAGHSHSLINDGSEDLVFFAVVTLQ